MRDLTWYDAWTLGFYGGCGFLCALAIAAITVALAVLIVGGLVLHRLSLG